MPTTTSFSSYSPAERDSYKPISPWVDQGSKYRNEVKFPSSLLIKSFVWKVTLPPLWRIPSNTVSYHFLYSTPSASLPLRPLHTPPSLMYPLFHPFIHYPPTPSLLSRPHPILPFSGSGGHRPIRQFPLLHFAPSGTFSFSNSSELGGGIFTKTILPL